MIILVLLFASLTATQDTITQFNETLWFPADMFNITVQAQDKLQIKLYWNDSSNLDLDIYVYMSGSAFYGFEEIDSSYDLSMPEVLQMTVPETDTYYIYAQFYSGDEKVPYYAQIWVNQILEANHSRITLYNPSSFEMSLAGCQYELEIQNTSLIDRLKVNDYGLSLYQQIPLEEPLFYNFSSYFASSSLFLQVTHLLSNPTFSLTPIPIILRTISKAGYEPTSDLLRCQKSCNSIPHAIDGGFSSDECICQQNYYWKDGQCLPQCGEMKYAHSDSISSLQCGCISNFEMINTCQISCSSLEENEGKIQGSLDECQCSQTQIWNKISRKCVSDIASQQLHQIAIIALAVVIAFFLLLSLVLFYLNKVSQDRISRLSKLIQAGQIREIKRKTLKPLSLSAQKLQGINQLNNSNNQTPRIDSSEVNIKDSYQKGAHKINLDQISKQKQLQSNRQRDEHQADEQNKNYNMAVPYFTPAEQNKDTKQEKQGSVVPKIQVLKFDDDDEDEDEDEP